MAPTHELRAEINTAVCAALAAEGVLRGRTLRIDRLVGRGMTRAEKADVRNYRDSDTVLFNQDMVNFRMKRDEPLARQRRGGTGVERPCRARRVPPGASGPCAGRGHAAGPAAGWRT